MALCDVHFKSDVLTKQVGMNVILPEVGEPPFPTFYLLHGLSDDYTIWMRRTRIEHYVSTLPIVVVMPDGYRGFYTDSAQGPAYAKFFSTELIRFVERNFPVEPKREARCVGGLSMGGYGALRLSLGFPELFVSAVSHSGAVLHGSRNGPRPGGPLDRTEFQRIFGTEPAGTDHDLLELAKRAKSQGLLPKIRIDCGTDDELLEDNRQLHAKLDALRIPHEYEEFPGGHNWDFWDTHVQRAIQFHMRNLGVTKT